MMLSKGSWNKDIEDWMPKDIPKEVQSEIKENTKDDMHIQVQNHLTSTSINQIFNIIDKHCNDCFSSPFYVLEIGTFQMYALKPFMDRGYYCAGVDVLRSSLEKGYFVDIKSPMLRRVCSMMEELRFEDALFDAIFMQAVLHHTKDPEKVCADMFRFLKPNGIIVIANEPYKSFIDRKDSRMQKNMEEGHNDNYYPLSRYLKSLKTAGFKDIRILPVDYYKDIKPLNEFETRPYKRLIANSVSGILKNKVLYWFFEKTFPTTCRVFSLPVVISAKKIEKKKE